MKRWVLSGFAIAAVSLSTCCTKKHVPAAQVLESPETQEPLERVQPGRLRTEIEKRWSGMRPPVAIDRTLIQLGIPSDDGVIVWVAPPPGKKLPAVSASAGSVKQIALSDLTHRIEVSGLAPDSEVTVRVGDEEVTARTAPSSTQPTEMFSFTATSCSSMYEEVIPFKAGSINQMNLLSRLASGKMGRDATLPARPSFSLALGDQVYVDEGPYKLFEGTNSDKFRFDLEDSSEILDVLYRAHFSLPPTDVALRLLPHGMMWDDHEIRDGWGSHGDEGDAAWQAYFPNAREHFLAWQAGRNPGFDPDAGEDALQDYQFSWGRNVRVFMMDGRSQRRFDKVDPTASIGPLGRDGEQLGRVKSWLAEAPDDEPMLMVLGNAVPISLSYSLAVNAAPEFKDDVRDGWHSEPSRADSDALLTQLVEHFTTHERHRLLVLSGDVHESGFFYWEVGDGDSRRIIGHEVVSSGITSGIPGPDYLKSAADLAKAIGPEGHKIHVTPRSSIRAPSFAEVVVKFDPEPQVGVIYYTSGTSKDRLTNWAAAPFWGRETGAVEFPGYDPQTNYTISWLSMDEIPESEGKAWVSFFVPGTVWDYSDSLHGHSVRCKADVLGDEAVKYAAAATHWFEVFGGNDRRCEVETRP